MSLADEAGEPSLLEQEKMAEEQVRAEVLAEPNVQAVMEAFPEAALEILRTDERRMTMPSLEEIMKMAQDVQAEMQQAQENLDKIEVEGASRRRAGQDPRHRQGPDPRRDHRREPAAAVREDHGRGSDRRRAQRRQGQGRRGGGAEMEKMTSGIPLPPGFKLPF